MHLTRSTSAIDNTDWLKTAAIIFVVIDHIGYFFIENEEWWSVLGRLAAPIFFFLLGYAETKTVPMRWLVLGLILTVLESWNANWHWVVPNILFSLALIRVVRPFLKLLLQRHGLAAFVCLTAVLLAAVPFTGSFVDYGTAGWLWAVFGLVQRIYVDTGLHSCSGDGNQDLTTSEKISSELLNLMRVLACLAALGAYIWQEQQEFSFSGVQLASFIVGVCLLTYVLYRFSRGPSDIQPSEPVASLLRFCGRHTLEIYAIQLAGSELIVKLAPDLAV